MPIDEKPAAAWTEDDLQELIGRRETAQLEFKQELVLATDGQKSAVEHDIQGVANAGGGYLIYGVEEEELADGSKVARLLVPLVDGGLYEQLNNVLDGRGEPRVPFDLYPIPADAGGLYLVVEVFGRRRPHMAQDGRYWLRRNLLVRRMTEAEVAEAYRDRFARERLTEQEIPLEVDADFVDERVHRGLNAAELALYREERGDAIPPGWFSVVAHAVPVQPNLLDPVDYDPWAFHEIAMEDRWRTSEPPLRHYSFERTLSGFRAQLPPRDDTYPRYLIQLLADGVFEFGDLLEPPFPDQHEARSIPSIAIAEYAHDHLLLFARVFELAGFEGEVRAFARLDGVAGYRLGINPAYAGLNIRPLRDDTVESQAWNGSVRELEAVGCVEVARDISNRLFVAADAGRPPFFDATGSYRRPE
jgi:hypothetical protein